MSEISLKELLYRVDGHLGRPHIFCQILALSLEPDMVENARTVMDGLAYEEMDDNILLNVYCDYLSIPRPEHMLTSEDDLDREFRRVIVAILKRTVSSC